MSSYIIIRNYYQDNGEWYPEHLYVTDDEWGVIDLTKALNDEQLEITKNKFREFLKDPALNPNDEAYIQAKNILTLLDEKGITATIKSEPVVRIYHSYDIIETIYVSKSSNRVFGLEKK